jgi:hypothetical protein
MGKMGTKMLQGSGAQAMDLPAQGRELNRDITTMPAFSEATTIESRARKALPLILAIKKAGADNPSESERLALLVRTVSGLYDGSTRAVSEIDKLSKNKGVSRWLNDFIQESLAGQVSSATMDNLEGVVKDTLAWVPQEKEQLVNTYTKGVKTFYDPAVIKQIKKNFSSVPTEDDDELDAFIAEMEARRSGTAAAQ